MKNLTAKEIEKIVNDVMAASARVGYNKGNTEIQLFVEQYNGDLEELPVKIMAKIAEMRFTEKDFDWDLFKNYLKKQSNQNQ